VYQSAWNYPAITSSLTNTFIGVVDLQFLGMGRARCGFDIDGGVVYTHEFDNAGHMDVPYMQTATLPIQAQFSVKPLSNCFHFFFMFSVGRNWAHSLNAVARTRSPSCLL
jgi:hypothetical protein